RSQLITLGALLRAVAGVAVGGGGAAAMGALGAGQSAMLNYSRADETEADHIGLQFMIKAGYPPSGLANGFKILRSKSQMMGISVPTYLSTHPDIGDRINGIQTRMLSMPKSVVNRTVDDRRFKRMQVLLWGRYGTPETALHRFSGQDALSLMGRGMVSSRLNRVNDASACFDQAVAKAPSDSLVLREAGIFNYRKGSAAKARQLLQKALQLDPRDYMASFFLARLQDDEGQHAQAQQSFKNVLRAVPEDAEVHEALARSYGKAGNQALAYIHMTYMAIYSQNKRQVERYYDRAKALGQNTPEFKKMDSVYKERKEIWEKL
ncbi:MAG: tetratricopeptide repeat protein, partial [Desulfovibrionaceae bacterium]|nr:tetratricopeptide repeat protein [Desulfovibrionaceae bacterium]